MRKITLSMRAKWPNTKVQLTVHFDVSVQPYVTLIMSLKMKWRRNDGQEDHHKSLVKVTMWEASF